MVTKKMFRTIESISLLAIVVTALLMMVVSPTVQDKEPIKVGVTLPLTGPAAIMGEGALNGINLARGEFDGLKYNYEFIVEDDGYDLQRVLTNTNKFINIDGVDVIISFGSMSGNIVAPLAEKAEIIHFGYASDLTIAEGKFSFDHSTTPKDQVQLMLEEFKSRNIKTVAVMYATSPWEKSMIDEFEKQIGVGDIKIVLREEFVPRTVDFKSSILKVKESDADILLVLVMSPELEILFKEIHELSYDGEITTFDTFEASSEKDLFEGYWYIGSGYETEEFNSLYEEKYNESIQLGAANIYDEVKIIIETYESSDKKINSSEFVEAVIETKSFFGAFGEVVVDEAGIISPSATVRIIEGERIKILKGV